MKACGLWTSRKSLTAIDSGSEKADGPWYVSWQASADEPPAEKTCIKEIWWNLQAQNQSKFLLRSTPEQQTVWKCWRLHCAGRRFFLHIRFYNPNRNIFKKELLWVGSTHIHRDSSQARCKNLNDPTDSVLPGLFHIHLPTGRKFQAQKSLTSWMMYIAVAGAIHSRAWIPASIQTTPFSTPDFLFPDNLITRRVRFSWLCPISISVTMSDLSFFNLFSSPICFHSLHLIYQTMNVIQTIVLVVSISSCLWMIECCWWLFILDSSISLCCHFNFISYCSRSLTATT